MDLICQMRYGLQYHITLDAKSNSADTVQKNPSKNVLSQMIKTVSIRKLNDFNFQWTKTFFSEYFKPYRIPFYTFQGLQMYRNSRKSSIKPPGGLIFFKHFLEGLYREGGPYSIQRNASAGARFFDDGLVVPGRYTAFSNNKKMVTIERKVEKVKHMKLEVM